MTEASTDNPVLARISDTQRIGIVTVSLDLLREWLHLPLGADVIDVRTKSGGIYGDFEVLVGGPAVPETDTFRKVSGEGAGAIYEVTPTPHLNLTITVTAPKAELTLRE